MTVRVVSVTPATVVSRSDDVLHQDVGGEAVLLDLASEQYFGLDQVATRIWELIDGTVPLSAIHRQLCDEFDADPERIEADLLEHVRVLLDAGLLRG